MARSVLPCSFSARVSLARSAVQPHEKPTKPHMPQRTSPRQRAQARNKHYGNPKPPTETSMSTSSIIKSRETNERHAAQGLLRHLAGAFNEGGLDKMNTELQCLCVALSHSTPAPAAAIECWLAERARESLEASIAARAKAGQLMTAHSQAGTPGRPALSLPEREPSTPYRMTAPPTEAGSR